MATDTLIPHRDLQSQVSQALAEDVGDQDLTAKLIPEEQMATATIISREEAILCGRYWVDEVFNQVADTIIIDWHFSDGDKIAKNHILCTIQGTAAQLLTAERTAMNYLQTLSATATLSHLYASQVSDLEVTILDTRKTIPNLRLAQKYAVACGGCSNHRIGLFDGVLIKENHIHAAGSITKAISHAKQLYPNIAIEVEVENLTELEQALDAQADIVLLDNFDITTLRQAVQQNNGRARLEASGNIDLNTVRSIAETGVDRISVGALTKHIRAVDLSMRFH